ncbi:Uncharacterised protein [Helicobacter mustelae]|nr:Uncharacterised protein [Helicobacter mustelae]
MMHVRLHQQCPLPAWVTFPCLAASGFLDSSSFLFSFFHKGEGLEWQSRSLPLMDPHPGQALLFTRAGPAGVLNTVSLYFACYFPPLHSRPLRGAKKENQGGRSDSALFLLEVD